MDPTEEPKGPSTPLAAHDLTKHDDRPTMKPDEVFWQLYQENRIQARHFDDQRVKIGNIILLTAVGLTAAAAANTLQFEDWPLCLCIMLLGAFGSIFTTAYAKIAKLFMVRAKVCLRELDGCLSPSHDSECAPMSVRQRLKTANSEYAEASASLDKLIRNDVLPMLWPLIITVVAEFFMLYILGARVLLKVATQFGLTF